MPRKLSLKQARRERNKAIRAFVDLRGDAGTLTLPEQALLEQILLKQMRALKLKESRTLTPKETFTLTRMKQELLKQLLALRAKEHRILTPKERRKIVERVEKGERAWPMGTQGVRLAQSGEPLGSYGYWADRGFTAYLLKELRGKNGTFKADIKRMGESIRQGARKGRRRSELKAEWKKLKA